ncbi:GNAT family N-acetyltransferase [Vibrio europaeus]|uniref:GNAT family N-acetyltransferase n=1 Tax=Vibrio europaeus TaxID=300876 RepID=UPI00148BD8D1|nr:GNAT family N-acetyltransferase [Vibrio europaeus]NOH24338.1 GNAT family N-acetyltransferase [Vibrio europaeus]
MTTTKYQVEEYTGAHPKFNVASDYVITLYNELGTFPESQEWSVPENLTVILIRDMEGAQRLEDAPIIGGGIIDQIDQTAKTWMCQFLAVEKRYQGNGCGRKLVELLEKTASRDGGCLGGAYLDMDNKSDFWEHLGYTHDGLINMTVVRLCKPMAELLVECKPKYHIDMNDLMGLLNR